MVKVEFFGMYRLDYKMATWEIEAKDVNDLLLKLEKHNSFYSIKELKNSIVLLNGKNIMELRKFKTKLNSGDVVTIMSPASGG